LASIQELTIISGLYCTVNEPVRADRLTYDEFPVDQNVYLR
jgi:hypothetical protein